MSAPLVVEASAAVVSNAASSRVAEVWSRLATVADPELDESVTELGFVTAVEVEGGCVSVGFRLPTYWCAANFAYLMADDMRRAIVSLPWVTNITITLDEHMYAAEINRGVAAGRSFQQTFGGEANGEVEDVRRIFLVKAFQRRQEVLLSWLLGQGNEPAKLVRLSVAQLSELAGERTDDGKTQRLVARYFERRFVAGRCADAEAEQGETLAFVDAVGEALVADELGAYLRALRRVGVNAEFNGALCRGLLAARYGEDCVSAPPVEIKPVHFVRTRDAKPGGSFAPAREAPRAAD
ncbi:MAG TPA: iron-sulfur cluster assembly protein [Paraburkholderia sp.]|uniref:iron-sulfur cluster assembly protein n=1 Tax=Paraburkholderia sp. TaxID=1926495 RepID=UPI002B499832|nr:iron-sulfur cluster assembly protein [Paraburkholderia sp.]HKR40667.1 iron-sulfur cluster assembly protein [Paraburkholderia sp.]